MYILKPKSKISKTVSNTLNIEKQKPQKLDKTWRNFNSFDKNNLFRAHKTCLQYTNSGWKLLARTDAKQNDQNTIKYISYLLHERKLNDRILLARNS